LLTVMNSNKRHWLYLARASSGCNNFITLNMSIIKSHVQCNKMVDTYIAVGFHGFKLGVNGTYSRLVF